MTKLTIISLLVLLAGCTSRTQYGPCVGLNGYEDPNLVYEYNHTNIVIGFMCMELVVPPVVVLLDELKCPVGEKK